MKAKRPPSLAAADISAAAFAYLERFDASPERLRAVLRRRIARARADGAAIDAEAEAAAQTAIDAAVADCVRLGLVDADGYAERRLRGALRRGASPRLAVADATAKGRDGDAARRAYERLADETPALEVEAARAYLKRRRLGPFATRADPDGRMKAVTALRRRGFSRAAAETAVDED